jgi:hypothetical protein
MDFDYFPLEDGEPGLRTVQISTLGRRSSWQLARVDSWKRQLKYIQLPSLLARRIVGQLLEKQPLVGAEHPERELRGTIARFDDTQIRDFRDVCIFFVPSNDGCCHRRWWIIRSTPVKACRAGYSSVGSPDRPPLPEVRLHPSPLLTPSPTSSQHDTATTSGFNASQAETGSNGQVSTSRAVHRRWVLPAAIAGVRCR